MLNRRDYLLMPERSSNEPITEFREKRVRWGDLPPSVWGHARRPVRWLLIRLVQTALRLAELSAHTADAKTKICAAADTVRKGVSLNTTQPPADRKISPAARGSGQPGSRYIAAGSITRRVDPRDTTELADAAKKSQPLMDLARAPPRRQQNSEPNRRSA